MFVILEAKEDTTNLPRAVIQAQHQGPVGTQLTVGPHDVHHSPRHTHLAVSISLQVAENILDENTGTTPAWPGVPRPTWPSH